jgi:hypothetical protein
MTGRSAGFSPLRMDRQSDNLQVLGAYAGRVRDGKLVHIGPPVLEELIATYLGAPCLVDRGGADGRHFVIEAVPLDIPRRLDVLRRVLAAKSREEGGLLERLPKVRSPDAIRRAAA